MELKNRKEVRGNPPTSLNPSILFNGTVLYLFIDIHNKTWESVEESVRWDDRRERKNNCEEKRRNY